MTPIATSRKLAAAALLIAAVTALAQTAEPADSPTADTLKSGFENPPNSARPRVWWHWLNGNITQQGIQLDLEWMHRVGIAGFQNFDADLGTPQVVPHRLAYMTPEWKKTFLFATQLADKLGMEEAIAGSPGWSETGGPWVKPNEAMKKYVWSEIEVEGGKPFSGKLPHPPANTGAFQNMGNHDDASDANPTKHLAFYADSAVIAYKLPQNDIPTALLNPKITASSGQIDPKALSDGDYVHGAEFPAAPAGQTAWLRYEFPKPTAVQAVTLVSASTFEPISTFEASDDGKTFRPIAQLDIGSVGTTTAFPPVTARYFRVTFKTPTPNADSAPAKSPLTLNIPELILHAGARVNRFQEKAAFDTENDLYQFATPAIAPADAIDKSTVIDLTSKMAPDGSLTWTPPAENGKPARWTIVRLGYSLLGINNHPASREATGLEVDKLNHTYVKNYMTHYLNQYRDTLGSDWMGKRGLKYVITDSWEAGSQNWTDDMIAQFTRDRGYSPIPWLPVLTGHIVQSAEASDRFLWDFRKTIADLIANEHYGQVEASIHDYGLGHYGESHEGGRAFVGDGMEVKKLNEIPMSAMWTQSPGVNNELYGYNADDRESASVAHIYGQNLAAAESMTAYSAPWAWSPATLKPTADKELAEGINRFVIHCSVHQPLVGPGPGKLPALGLGPYGQWFTRNETWAEQAAPWVTYLARSSFLLQQGKFSADILYFYGEDSNITAIFGGKNPDIPEGYGFDYLNADALIHVLSVKDGQVITPSGMSYKVLALDPYSRHMSLPVLKALHTLVEAGATVTGPKPTNDPSLSDNPAEFAQLSTDLFGDGTGIHQFGKGHVYAGQSLAEALPKLNLAPDFDYTKPDPKLDVLFVHRHTSEADLYYVDNRSDKPQTLDATFRIAGKQPEIWHAETGLSEPASYSIANGKTTVPLTLDPWGAVFVVFRQPPQSNSRTIPKPTETTLTTLHGPWIIAFQPNRGAPASATLPELASWSTNPNPGIEYFSGLGTYTQTVEAPAAWFAPNAKLLLDLGDVKNLAEVTINGQPAGTAWHTPYRVDASALKPGHNTIEIKVANAWVNRLIGDQQPNAEKITFTIIHPYKADSPLLPSGLLGPVTIIQSITR